ncbi:MAG: PKD domain-containing protein [Ferruginibacter sp.]
MRKIFVFLTLAMLLLFAKTQAQTNTNCNADFAFTIYSYTVGFAADSDPDSAWINHVWNFGDGAIINGSQRLFHAYTAPGTYTVKHTVKKLTPNGAVVCEKTVSKDVVIQPVPIPCDLGAGFNFKRDSVQKNKVYFTNITPAATAGVKYQWSFGDGKFSDARNPVHTYDSAGLYYVCLQVRGGDSCYDDSCRYIQLQTQPTDSCGVGADFSFYPDLSEANRIQFNSTVSFIPYADSIIIVWSFGDGTISYDMNPSHVFASPGTYNVCLKVSQYSGNPAIGTCSKEICRVVTVTQPVCDLNADFTYTKDSIPATALFAYRFTNTSQPLNSYDSVFWDFGDNTLLVNENNPVHVYSQPGTYTVCLTIKRRTDSLSIPYCLEKSICKTITVNPLPQPCSLNVNFVSHIDSLDKKSIHFINMSQPVNITAFAEWSFGDGTMDDHWNADHVYEHPGVYTVCLKIKQNDSCIREMCKTIIVDSALYPCNINPGYNFTRDSAQPNKVYFYSSPVASNDIVKWSFGDGTYSYDQNPVHIYSAAGLYNICLTVTRNNTCSKDTCGLLQVNGPAPCSFDAGFTYFSSAGSGEIYFNNSTILHSSDSVYWSFGDGTYSYDYSPAHKYNVPGVYAVCLRVTRVDSTGIAPCIKEYCQSVHVKDTCNLQADFIVLYDSTNIDSLGVYKFKDISQPYTAADSLFWDFGDGSPVVINQHEPEHIYEMTGSYTVCLTIKKRSSIPGNADCVSRNCKMIYAVSNRCKLQANFGWVTDSSSKRKIKFHNSTAALNTATDISWYFGDGSSSTDPNPVHEYAVGGTYTVCLNVRQSNTCFSNYCNIVVVDSVVQHDSCSLQPGFIHQQSSTGNRKVFFTNTTEVPSSAAQAEWTFGDGTSASGWNAEHMYAQAGTYIVCLKIDAGADCVRYTCDTIIIDAAPPAGCGNIFAKFETRKDSYLPNKIYFTAATNMPQPNQTWLITNLFALDTTAVLQQNNPAYSFKDTGYYNVCLVVSSNSNSCVEVSCKPVYINSITAPVQCVLQSYPNPVHGEVKVNLELTQAEQIKVAVFNIQNVQVLQKSQQGVVGNNTVQLNTSLLVPGFYTIRFVYGNNVCYSRFQKL